MAMLNNHRVIIMFCIPPIFVKLFCGSIPLFVLAQAFQVFRLPLQFSASSPDFNIPSGNLLTKTLVNLCACHLMETKENQTQSTIGPSKSS